MTWHNVRAISQYVGVESGTGKINFTFSREGTKAGLVVHVHCDWKTYLCLAAIDSRMIETCRIRKQEVKVIQLCHSQYLAGTRVLFTFVPSGRPNMFAKCWSELASGAEWPSCFEKWGLPGAKLWARWPWCQHERLILVNVEESLMSTQTTNNSYIAARLDSFFYVPSSIYVVIATFFLPHDSLSFSRQNISCERLLSVSAKSIPGQLSRYFFGGPSM